MKRKIFDLLMGIKAEIVKSVGPISPKIELTTDVKKGKGAQLRAALKMNSPPLKRI